MTSVGNIITLRDGTRVRLRQVCPSDAEYVRRGYREMSETSRYMRFFVPGDEMSESQAKYFCEVDQINHVAICAIEPVKEDRGYGIARFVRDAADPSVAEFAIAVIDEMQGRGLGTVLLAGLYIKAKALGVRVLKGDYMAENPVIPFWLPLLGAWIEHTSDPTFGSVHWPLDRVPETGRFSDWVRNLKGVL